MMNALRFPAMLLCIVLLWSCTPENEVKKKESVDHQLFTLLNNGQTDVHFKSSITETADFNILNYYYTYNGGGVAIGDLNNDGLVDIYFTSDQQYSP